MLTSCLVSGCVCITYVIHYFSLKVFFLVRVPVVLVCQLPLFLIFLPQMVYCSSYRE